MAAFVKFQNFVEDLGNGVHDLVGIQHTLKVYLTNTAPNVATHAVKADLAEIAAGNGYTAGGDDTQNDGSEASGTPPSPLAAALADPLGAPRVIPAGNAPAPEPQPAADDQAMQATQRYLSQMALQRLSDEQEAELLLLAAA